VLGPWLLFVDVQAFVGLNTYWPQRSDGPLRHYASQFSYIGHHALGWLEPGHHAAVKIIDITNDLSTQTAKAIAALRKALEKVKRPVC
jgi:hypothetical protein